ncbi:MAG: arginine deiminase [Erysipelotrichaceae bacterium]|nr:arginine deiminase [Erysipelotrichaceae bacterium]
MTKIHVTSEIKPLKKVLLHRPGEELLNLTPTTLSELLFDDIPDLVKAQEEHDRFAQILRDNGVEVVYLEDLMAETLDAHPEIKEQFLDQFITEGDIHTETYHKILKDYFNTFTNNKDLVLKTMAGVTFAELGDIKTNFLVDKIDKESYLLLNPMPNLYFTRDPFSSVGNGAVINRMYSVTRNRETIYADYIFRFHPEYAGKVPDLYGRNNKFHIEGGDVLNVNEKLLFIGISQRTQADAIQALAMKMFYENPENKIETILAFNIPNNRAMMHLDTVFTQIDHDAFTYHPGIMGTLQVFAITADRENHDVKIEEHDGELSEILAKFMGLDKVRLFACGAGDPIAAEREQWNDGSNTLTIAPGKIVVYKRNYVTNKYLKENGFEVLELDADNLCVGRGGPRCMSMPLVRED